MVISISMLSLASLLSSCQDGRSRYERQPVQYDFDDDDDEFEFELDIDIDRKKQHNFRKSPVKKQPIKSTTRQTSSSRRRK